jgi:hypothetical protein
MGCVNTKIVPYSPVFREEDEKSEDKELTKVNNLIYD